MQNFKDGRHDRNGIDQTIYTGCCDAARDGFTGNKFDQYQEVKVENDWPEAKRNSHTYKPNGKL